MGIIAISSSKLKYDVIKRLKHSNKVGVSAASVKVTLYDGSSFKGLSKVKLDQSRISPYKQYMHLNQTLTFSGMLHRVLLQETILAQIGLVTSQATTVCESTSVKFLPIIDLNPSDETCTYFTLLFVIGKEAQYSLPWYYF